LFIGAGLLQRLLHLFDAYPVRIEDHGVDLAPVPPAFVDPDDSFPPFQGGFADIVSADGEGRLLCCRNGYDRQESGVGGPAENQQQYNYAHPFHGFPP